jgi:heat shock protein HslJ
MTQRFLTFPVAAVLLSGTLVACVSADAPSTGDAAVNEAATASTASYTARGNEPFWQLEIDGPRTRWITPNGEVDGAGARLTTTSIACQDSMSGQIYPQTAEVLFGGTVYRGCGGEPVAAWVGDWAITAVNGAGVLSGGSAPSLSFDAAGTVSGSTGCNRLFGEVQFDGEGLRFGRAAMTRMACLADGVMAQENAIGRVLDGPVSVRFGVDSNERILTNAAGGSITLKRASPH